MTIHVQTKHNRYFVIKPIVNVQIVFPMDHAIESVLTLWYADVSGILCRCAITKVFMACRTHTAAIDFLPTQQKQASHSGSEFMNECTCTLF